MKLLMKQDVETSRHIMLSSRLGIITELERIGDALGSDQYILRYHRASEIAGLILDVAAPSDRIPWVGFHYQNAHWSFLKQVVAQNPV